MKQIKKSYKKKMTKFNPSLRTAALIITYIFQTNVTQYFYKTLKTNIPTHLISSLSCFFFLG